MQMSLAAFVKTVTGKTIAGLLVATTSVGAAAAAGADVPVLDTVIHRGADDDRGDEFAAGPGVDDRDETPDPARSGKGGDEPAADDGEDRDDENDENASDGELDGDEDAADDENAGDHDDDDGDDDGDDEGDDENAGDEDDGDDGDEPDDGHETDEGEDRHGQIVSEFTRITAAELELTGCAKGQATAAVARGDVQVESEDLADDLAPFIERCPHQDAEGDQVEDDPDGDPAHGAESVEGDLDPQQVHEEGKAAFHDAQRAYADECGDDDESSEGDESGDDDSMSERCRELKTAAKAAHAEWKSSTTTARDAAKDARRGDDEVTADLDGAAGADADAGDQPGKGKGNGKSNGNGNGTDKDRGSSNGKGNGQGKNKNG